jgi:hypothetical protein
MKKSQCRSLINCICHNFRSIIVCFFVLFLFILQKNMAAADNTSDKKVLTLVEVQKLAEDKSKCILVINDRVYDVTQFIDEVCDYVIQ